MGMYEVPLYMPLLGIWDGDYDIQLLYVWYYVGPKNSFHDVCKECGSKRAYV